MARHLGQMTKRACWLETPSRFTQDDRDRCFGCVVRTVYGVLTSASAWRSLVQSRGSQLEKCPSCCGVLSHA